MHQFQSKGPFGDKRTLSIMPTYQCNAACKDCGTYSHPKERTTLSIDAVLRSIELAKENGFVNVVFTGGEATLQWQHLLVGLRRCRALNLHTRLVTNAHWARTPERARQRLDELIEAGLDEINFSTGDEHVRFVPLQSVIRATQAALEHGLRTFVMIEMRHTQSVRKEDVLEHSDLADLSPERRGLLQVMESPWMPLAPLTIERYPEDIAVNRANLAACTGCDSVLQTYVVQPDGRVGACCGLGMRAIPELNVATVSDGDFLAAARREAEDDFLKVWIRYKGPERILAWAAERDPTIVWENLYAHRCQACVRLYRDPKVASVVHAHYEEMLAEVVQCAWMQERFIPQHLRSPD
jgi:organic radical activating enzyme